LAALLSATWVFALAVTLRYCQGSITIERQYDYLQKLEDKLSPEFGGTLYRREGREYHDRYPAFSSLAWRFYTVLLPVIAILAAGVLIHEEIVGLSNPVLNKILDGGIALYIVFSFFLYRIGPLLKAAWHKVSENGSQSEQR
jgi:hypothetical protein